MVKRSWVRHTLLSGVLLVSALALGAPAARADGDLQRLNHIIIAMQENHSFDNYLGVLAYVPNSPYHPGRLKGPRHACAATDHTCVDGLTCVVSRRTEELTCLNSIPSNTRGSVRSFHDYASDVPYSALMFHVSAGHQKPVTMFATDAASGTLPAVAFVDPSFVADQAINGSQYETDEHPPNDIRAGEYFVSQIITALRNSPSWHDSILFLTYDEHGGFYDHVKPPAALQGNALTPDGIAPGQCADASNPPASEEPGGGANCADSKTMDAPMLCSAFTPTGTYPASCATFDQLGFRLPLIAVSPFAKPHYVSHVIGSHTSLLALIEKRFSLPSLTARDANANDLEDLFDFDSSPSLSAMVGTAPLPRQPPAVTPGDPGCPF
jgi:phospholipase C